MTLLVRTATPPGMLATTIRDEVGALDRSVPVYAVRTLREHIGLSAALDRTMAALLTVAGVLALALAAIGIYGVISYAVAQQTREIGIRIALGAAPRRMLSLVLTQGLHRAIAGIALGIAGAAALTRMASTMLFEISPTDPLTFAAISLVLFVVALAATAVPARRAMRIDPLVALKND
jgi:putative ABC transport system permease protein